MPEILNQPDGALRRKLPVAAIVGRPNVGKSSLFNAIVGMRISIVHEMPGVTRDRVIAPAVHNGIRFELIDTGGLATRFGESRNLEMWDERIAGQVDCALADADVLIMVTDVQNGLTSLDEEAAQKLRASGKPVVVVANKADNPVLERDAADMSSLGFESIFPVSCQHRSGISMLLDKVVALLPASEPEAEEAAEAPVKIAVVGRPNVGKSSLINALLGEDRVMVSDVPGTTRDAIDVDFSLEFRGAAHPAVLIDTAGLRKKSKVDGAVEMFSVMRSQTAIERADLVVMVLEAGIDGVTAQDRRIAGMIERAGRACVLAVNKIDLCAEYPAAEVVKQVRYSLPGMSFAPLVLLSAAKKRNLSGLLDSIAEVMGFVGLRMPTSTVNQVLSDAFEKTTPPVIGSSPLRFYYGAQVSAAPPRFVLFVNDKKYCADNYLAYLKNALRQAFDFVGQPIVVELRSRPKKVASVHTPARSERKSAPKKRGSAVSRGRVKKTRRPR